MCTPLLWQANAKAAGDVAASKYEDAKDVAGEYAAAGQQKGSEAYNSAKGAAAGAAQVRLHEIKVSVPHA